MFCSKCGKPLDGDKTLCDECAGIQKQEAAPAEPVTQSAPETESQPVIKPAETQLLDEHSRAYTQGYTQDSPQTFQLNTAVAQEVKPVKAKTKGKKIALISSISAAAVVVIGVLLVVLNFNTVRGLFLKNFGEPSDYMSHVEEQSLGGVSSALSSAYGSFLSASSESSGAARFEVELEVGDDLMELLEAALAEEGAEVDLSWLNKMMLSLDSNMQDEKAQASVGFGLSDKQLITLDMIYDLNKQIVWLGVPELNDQYIAVNTSDMLEEAQISFDPEQLKEYEDIQKALPSEKTVSNLLDKYIAIALGCIDDVKKETETVEIDGVRQKLTVLTIKIKEKTLYEMAIAVLEEAKDDKEIEKILTDFEDFYNDYNADMMAEYSDEEYEPVDLYEAFFEGVDEALDLLHDLADEADSDNYVKLVDYVDNSSKVVGRKVSVYSADADKMDLFDYLTVRSGSKFAFEAEIPSAEIKMTGSGTEKGNKINGNYDIRYQKTELVEIDVVDFDSKKLDNGYLNGTIRVSPTSELLDMVMSSSSDESDTGIPSSMMSLIEEIAIELKFESSEDLTKIGINLVSDNDLLIGLATSAIQKKAQSVKVPDNAVDITEMDENAQSALTEWVGNMKIDEFIQSLKDAGVPAEYADMLSGLGDMIAAGGFAGEAEEDSVYPSDEWEDDAYWGIDAGI